MKEFLPALFAILFPLVAQAEPSEESALRFMNTWVESFNKNDPKKISAFYEVDERVDMLVSRGLWLRGHKNIFESYERDMKLVRFYDSESERMNVRVYDQTALVSFIHKFKFEILQDKSQWQIHIRTTTTLRHTKSGWKIAMEHSSGIRGVERETRIK